MRTMDQASLSSGRAVAVVFEQWYTFTIPDHRITLAEHGCLHWTMYAAGNKRTSQLPQ